MSKVKYILPALLCLLLSAAVFAGMFAAPSPAYADGAEGKTVVLDNCDSTLAVKGASNIRVDKTNYITGSGSLQAISGLGTINFVFRDVDYANLPAFEDAYLEMYLYIGDVDNIATEGGALELTSSGVNDMDEVSVAFTPTKIGMKTGWNYISLRLADFTPSSANPGGEFKYEEICGMRLFAFPKDSSKLLEIGVDEIIITDAPRIDAVREEGIQVQNKPYGSIGYKVRDDVASMVYNGDPSAVSIAIACVCGAVFVAAAAYVVVVLVKQRGKKKNESR